MIEKKELAREAARYWSVIEATRGDESAIRRNAGAWFALGTVQMKLGELSQAESSFEQAANAWLAVPNPRLVVGARLQQAGAARRAGRSRVALALVDEIIDRYGGIPHDVQFPAVAPAGYLTWIVVLDRLGEWQRVVDAAELVVLRLGRQTRPLDQGTVVEAQHSAGQALRRLHRPEEAIRVFEDAIDRSDRAITAGVDDPRGRFNRVLADSMLERAEILAATQDPRAELAFVEIIKRFALDDAPAAKHAVLAAERWLEFRG